MSGNLSSSQPKDFESKQQFISRTRDEYVLLQRKIDNYGDTSLKMKGFTITITLGVSLFSLREASLLMPTLGLVGVLLLFYFEGINNVYHDIVKKRAYQIEKAITNPLLRSKIRSPHIGHQLKSAGSIEIRDIFDSIKRAPQLRTFYGAMMFILLVVFMADLCVVINRTLKLS